MIKVRPMEEYKELQRLKVEEWRKHQELRKQLQMGLEEERKVADKHKSEQEKKRKVRSYFFKS
jgi:hypothetical protein